MRYGIIGSLVLGGRTHSGVTFAACESCPTGSHKGRPIVGLLGMNVIGRYRTTFDHSKGVIEMSPTAAYNDRSADIEPWLKMEFLSFQLHKNGRFWVGHGIARNRAKRSIKQLTVGLTCSGGTPATAEVSVSAKNSKKFRIVVKDGDCKVGWAPVVAGARW